jgi:PII-like signaling protein
MACRALGIKHHLYLAGTAPVVTPGFLLWVGLAGICFGLTSVVFAELTHSIQHYAKSWVSRPWLRPFFGGMAVIGLTFVFGTRDYLGLSLPLMEQSFTPGGVALWAFALKIMFTAVTLGTGFKGGEVTPLFCIGSTLGASFAAVTGQPVAPFAALGFVAVFAGAANTPLACVLMGIELFGAEFAVPLTLACVVSYIASGHRGIYLSQEVDTPKATNVVVPFGTALRDAHAGALEVALPGAFRVLNGGRKPLRTERIMTVSKHHKFQASAYGQLRVFLRSGERPRPSGWRERLSNPPVYLRIINKAREFGVTHGTVKQCVTGFMDRGQLQHDHVEYGNAQLPVYVELLGTRAMLEEFCHHAVDLLRGRVIVYKDVERWHWGELVVTTMPVDEGEEGHMAG